MPVRIGKIPGTEADAFLHTCEKCGDNAFFGIGVSYRAALNAINANQIPLAKKLLGQWYCLTHWRQINERKAT